MNHWLSALFCKLASITLFVLLTGCNGEETESNVKSFQSVRYVATDGSDISGKGTIENPYGTLSKALRKSFPGLTVIVREGIYHEEVTLDSLRGTAEKPITIRAHTGESVTISGTKTIKQKWHPLESGIWSTTVNQPVWQLFVDGEQMVPARWPNARFDDATIYSEQVWSKAIVADSPNGRLADDPSHHDLSQLNVDLVGGIVVANVGSFFTWTRTITAHQAGENALAYELAPWVKRKHYKYFVEGKLGLLDTPTEWFFEPESKKVYLMPKSGNPNTQVVTAKVRSHGIQVADWSHVVIENMTFNAAPIECADCHHVTLENLVFNYAGVSRRMLGETGVTADMVQLKSADMENGYFVVRNCEIRDTDSQALVVHGSHSIIENNYFENTDYAVSQTIKPSSDIALAGDNVIFRRNTVVNSGNSATLAIASSRIPTGKREGTSLLVELNDMSQTGFAQTDGSAIQIHIPAQNGVIVRNNWIHDTPKMAIRFDAPLPATRWGKFGLVHNNVMWNSGGMMIKGTDHTINNNVLLNTPEVHDLVILDDKVTDKLLKRKNIAKDTVIGGKNVRTKTFNNIASRISGHRKRSLPLPGIHSDNLDLLTQGLREDEVFINTKQRDFRPKLIAEYFQTLANEDQTDLLKTPYLGAYSPQPSDNYWIPGRLQPLASHPIPYDNTFISGTTVDIMWREAYDTEDQRLYIAYNKQDLSGDQAPKLKPVYRGMQRSKWTINAVNQAFYWRVDSLVNGRWLKGAVWTVNHNAHDVSDSLSHSALR